MDNFISNSGLITHGAEIINRAQNEGLDLSLLYEAVIDLSSQGLLTTNCINMAAGILLEDLGLPQYFFQYIQKDSLIGLLQVIANSIQLIDGKVVLYDRAGHIDFDFTQRSDVQWVRIATQETCDNMESVLSGPICGHPREYYYSPKVTTTPISSVLRR